MKKVFVFILFIFVSVVAICQDSIFVSDVGGGLELQVYPTGVIGAVNLYKEIKTKSFIHCRFGYNLIRHGDAGVHQDERGNGWGGSVGYDYALRLRKRNVLMGLRCDLWQNSINWKNNIGTSSEVSGKSKVTVVQPTFRIGFPIKLGGDFLIPEIAFGSEINVKTSGEEVGEGLILLLGFSYVIP